ncbi:MAG: hypothetical protein ACJAZ2_001453, partial [Glaciecola sp.]
MEYFSFFDLIFALILSFVLITKAKKKRDKFISTEPAYQFYSKGLAAKLFATFLFCSIYLFYYKGGDTLNYYKGIKCFYNVFWKSPSDYFYLLTHGYGLDTWGIFDHETGRPPKYMFRDSRTLLVLKLSSLLTFPALGGYFTTSILLATITYRWVWKSFTFVAERYPTLTSKIALCFLYLPSVIFWGSGIMKDTYTFAASCYALYACNEIFIKRKNIRNTTIGLLISIYIIISIKAYILFALLPGILIYLNFERIAKIKSVFVKVIIFPIITGGLFLAGQGFFMTFGDDFGKYSADRLLEEAAVQQQDLKRAIYGANSFDIGNFEPTISGVLSKSHLAINAALFRPYIWEVGSPTMLLSGVENSIFFLA